MLTALIWLAILSALIAGARILARRGFDAAPATSPANRLGRRFASRYFILIAITSFCFFSLLAVTLFQGGPASPILAGAGAAACLGSALLFARPSTAPRRQFETLALGVMSVIASIAVMTTFGIFLVLIVETVRFFEKVPITEFLFTTAWSPQTAIRADQVASEGAFGVLPLVTGTLLVTGVALLVAAPVGVMAAVYLESYAGAKTRDVLKLILELLAGVPTVVYGFFALLFVGPLISDAAAAFGGLFGASLAVPAQNALAAGLVTGVMIIPFVSSLSDDVISAIPHTLREGAFALGATKSETILKVILPAAAPGLVGAFLLAISRAIGETMIVVMAASRSANLTFNPFERVTTITVQIVALLTGDQEFDSAKTLAAFALGLMLFLITLTLNVVALLIVKQFRMRYE